MQRQYLLHLLIEIRGTRVHAVTSTIARAGRAGAGAGGRARLRVCLCRCICARAHFGRSAAVTTITTAIAAANLHVRTLDTLVHDIGQLRRGRVAPSPLELAVNKIGQTRWRLIALAVGGGGVAARVVIVIACGSQYSLYARAPCINRLGIAITTVIATATTTVIATATATVTTTITATVDASATATSTAIATVTATTTATTTATNTATNTASASASASASDNAIAIAYTIATAIATAIAIAIAYTIAIATYDAVNDIGIRLRIRSVFWRCHIRRPIARNGRRFLFLLDLLRFRRCAVRLLLVRRTTVAAVDGATKRCRG